MGKNKTNLLAILFLIFFATGGPAVFAADVEVQLDSNAATSALSLKNLSAVEKARMDATGAVTAAGEITAPNFVSNVAAGTQPYATTSTTVNTNLNADQWDSQHLPALSSGDYLTSNGSTLSWEAHPTMIAGASGAAGTKETWQVLTVDAAANNAVAPATVMSTTGLAAGIYLFEYTVIWRSAAVGTGINFQVDYTGTVTEVTTRREYGTTGTAASSGVADGVAAVLTGQLLEHASTRSDSGSLGPNTGVDTANANIIDHIRGVITVSNAGNLNLMAGTETAGTNITVQSGTCLVLRKLN